MVEPVRQEIMGLLVTDTKRNHMVRFVNVFMAQKSQEDSEFRQMTLVLETEIFLE